MLPMLGGPPFRSLPDKLRSYQEAYPEESRAPYTIGANKVVNRTAEVLGQRQGPVGRWRKAYYQLY
jgi:hypothetical protein